MGLNICYNYIMLINKFLTVKLVLIFAISLFYISIRLPCKRLYINSLKLTFLASRGSISRE